MATGTVKWFNDEKGFIELVEMNARSLICLWQIDGWWFRQAQPPIYQKIFFTVY